MVLVRRYFDFSKLFSVNIADNNDLYFVSYMMSTKPMAKLISYDQYLHEGN